MPRTSLTEVCTASAHCEVGIRSTPSSRGMLRQLYKKHKLACFQICLYHDHNLLTGVVICSFIMLNEQGIHIPVFPYGMGPEYLVPMTLIFS